MSSIYLLRDLRTRKFIQLAGGIAGGHYMTFNTRDEAELYAGPQVTSKGERTLECIEFREVKAVAGSEGTK